MQSWFMRGSGCVDEICVVRQMCYKYLVEDTDIYLVITYMTCNELDGGNVKCSTTE